jgi:hypothetical protein
MKKYFSFLCRVFFFPKNYHPIPLRDSISLPLAPISSMAGGDVNH